LVVRIHVFRQQMSEGDNSQPSTRCCGTGTSIKFRKNFREQKLPAWQPLYSSGYIALSFLIVGIIAVFLGGLITGLDSKVVNYTAEYTKCNDCHLQVAFANSSGCMCNITVDLPSAINGKVFVQYRLTNYYQNHRRYVTSRDDAQLRGDLSGSPSDDCKPYSEAQGKKIVPCGAIANSLFNDTFELILDDLVVPTTTKGIAWATDVGTKFNNPSSGWTPSLMNEYVKPPSWSQPIWEMTDAMQNEPFIVWMRTASVPDFSKPWAIVVQNGEFKDGLPKGRYEMQINYNYPVDVFKGRKYFILTNASIIGAENSFIGVAYLIVGAVSLLVAVIFLILKLKGPNSSGNRYPTSIDAPR
jgi:hypothetical protein